MLNGPHVPVKLLSKLSPVNFLIFCLSAMCLHAYSVWHQVHMSEGVHEARRRDLHQLELKLLAVVSYLMKEKTSRDYLSPNSVIKT